MTRSIALAAFAILALGACSPPQVPEKTGEHQMAHEESPDAAGGSEDANFGLRLALLEGHMRIGRELLHAGQAENALPHFGHPVRELYGDLRPVIAARGAEQFESDLVRAESLSVLEGESASFSAAFDSALAKVAAARATIPAATLNADEYVLRLAADMAGVAAQEYRNALVGGRIDSLIEYHDTRGFIFYAADLLHAQRSDDPRIAQAARLIGELKVFVEPLNPPSPPRATDAQFTAKAEELRALLSE